MASPGPSTEGSWGWSCGGGSPIGSSGLLVIDQNRGEREQKRLPFLALRYSAILRTKQRIRKETPGNFTRFKIASPQSLQHWTIPNPPEYLES